MLSFCKKHVSFTETEESAQKTSCSREEVFWLQVQGCCSVCAADTLPVAAVGSLGKVDQNQHRDGSELVSLEDRSAATECGLRRSFKSSMIRDHLSVHQVGAESFG